MAVILQFPHRRRGVLWMTLDEAEVYMAELAVQGAYDRLFLLRLKQFGKQLQGAD